ncbi:MAG: hypothetical protein GXP24_04100 [Planctomycetes bacterium]|nr:hypothetical protein [Planctomycetota bacterium]
MAKGKRRRGRRDRSRSNGNSKRLRTSFGGGAFSRKLRLEQLEDRRMLAVFYVTTIYDIEDDDGDGTFEIVPGSLRDAIEQANEFENFDTIVFSGLAFENQTTIFLQQNEDNFGQLEILNAVEIIGPGASKLTIESATGRRIFLVDDTSDDTTIGVTISGVTLAGAGSIAGDDEDGRGGAILNREALTLDQVQIINSTAPNGGGAVFNETGVLRVESSLILGNTSGQGGGGIQNGLVDQDDNFPRINIVNSTITGNRALGNPGEEAGYTGYGGGVLNAAGTVDINQSTVYGNEASYNGGGVASRGFDAEFDDEMIPTVYSGNATTTVRSSIIAGNLNSSSGVANDLGSYGMTTEDPILLFEPQINTRGSNLFGALTLPPSTVNPDVSLPPNGSDVVGIDPTSIFIDDGFFALLGDFGGNTRVFLPDPNKPGGQIAIDGGDTNTVTGDNDQRGRQFRRVFPTLGVMDIGAAEVQDGFFIVDSLLDESDGEFRFNDFTLREAIEFSEKNPNRDTVAFSLGLRDQMDPNPFTPAPTIVLELGEFRITEGVDILGPVFQLEIDGNSSSRIFNINDFLLSDAIDVLISDLTLTNGGGVINGGAILNYEDLTLNRSYLLGSSAALNGGSLFVQSGNVTIDSSTFSENIASNNGGGIYVDVGAGTVEIVNSTLSANESSNRGAGLTNLGSDTSVKNSTITLNNSASTRGSGITNLGGGLLTVYSSIVAGNLNTDIEFFGGPITNITSEGYNLVGVGNASGLFSGSVSGDIGGVLDPKLASLAFSGGPTPTHRILGDSPALDAGPLVGPFLPDFDQRGGEQFVRVFDGDLDGTAQVDIGAYELQAVTYTVTSIVDENDGNFTTGNLSFREAIEIANASVSPLPETIVFDAQLFGSTISLSPFGLAPFTSPDIKVTGPVEIFGPGITINGSGLFDGFNRFPMFTVDDGDDQSTTAVLFEDLTFRNGVDRAIVSKEDVEINSILATGNNGVFAQNLGTLTIRTSILTGNSTAGSGGAVAVTDGNLIVEGDPVGYGYTLITGNSTSASGGNGGGISFSDSTADGKTLSLNKVIISGNQAPAGTADGGGLFISGNGSASASTMTEATIQDTIISGNSTTGSNSEGAGLFAKDAEVTLTGVTVSLNRSFGTNSKGAGIFLSGGSLTIENSADSNSLITQNSTYGNFASGGGIANVGGDVVLNQVTISRNTTSGTNTNGAGIYSTGGNLTLNGTTVVQNSSEASGFNGGGIYSQTNLTGTQKTSVINSTVSGNTATLRGGGVFNAGGLLEIKYSTITNNSVPYFGNGGGVASLGNASTTRTDVRSSIIAGNFSTADLINPNSDVESVAGLTNSFVSLGYNVIGKGLPLALGAFNQIGDQANIVDPGLGPLTPINGGPTATHALLPTSPAINAGDPNAVAGVGDVPANDQRGAGFTRVNIGRIDVGSYESDLSPVLASTAADFDSDGDVDGSDFLAWQRGFGLLVGATPSDGDATGDGAVDGDDLTIWETDYGTGAVAAASAASSSFAASSYQDILVAPLEPLPGAPVLVASPVSSAESNVVAASASGQWLPGLSLTTVAAGIDSTSPAVVAETGVQEERDLLFADFAVLAVSEDYEEIAFEQSETAELGEAETEFSLEDQVFALLGS